MHSFIWLLVIIYKKKGKVERCLGSYYLEHEFWILDGPRLFQLVVCFLIVKLTIFCLKVNTFFIFNVIRVLWSKVRNLHNTTSEMDRMKCVFFDFICPDTIFLRI